MSRRADGEDAGHDLLVPLIGAQALEHLAAEDAAIVLEEPFHAALRRAAHLTVVHPELVLVRRNENLRVREGERVVGLEQPLSGL